MDDGLLWLINDEKGLLIEGQPEEEVSTQKYSRFDCAH
jgi:hypothetical protein